MGARQQDARCYAGAAMGLGQWQEGEQGLSRLEVPTGDGFVPWYLRRQARGWEDRTWASCQAMEGRGVPRGSR